jgi:lysophospholipase-2
MATSRALMTRNLAQRCLVTAAASTPRVSQDKSRGGLITIEPAEAGAHTATFVGPMHGLGDTNMGWLDVAVMWQKALPHVKFVLPNAPTAPVTLNGGMQMPSWFDLTSLDEFAQPYDGMDEARASVNALIEEEVAAGIPLDRIVVGGFSQGGALSLSTGLQYPGRLAGVCVLSGWFAATNGFALAPEAAETPVGHFHGVADPVVRVEWGRESARRLRELGVREYALKEYADLPHSASMEEIEDVTAWLLNRLPPLESAAA